MPNDKHIKVDLDFLDKNAKETPRRPTPIQPSSNGVNKPVISKKWRYLKGWLWVIGIFIVLAIIGSFSGDNSSSSSSSTYTPPTNSTYTPPVSVSTPNANENLIGQSGQTYSCSDYNYDQATALEPNSSTVSEMNEESTELDNRDADIKRESSEIDAMYVDRSDQTSLDAYNEAVDAYNIKLNQLKVDDASWNARNNTLNARIDRYNNFLDANCTPE